MYFARMSSRRPMLGLLLILSSAPFQLAAQSTPPRERSTAVEKPFIVEHGTALATVPLSGAPTNPGSILGDTVTIEYLYPNMGSPYGVMTSGVVTPEGVRLNLFNNDEIVVFPDSVDLLDINPNAYFIGAAFNGVSVRDETNPKAFVGALIGIKGNLPGFTTSNVSEADGLLFVNYQGLYTTAGAFESVRFFVVDHNDSEPRAPEDAN